MISPFVACMIGIVIFLLLLGLGLPVFVTMGLGAIVGIILSGNMNLLSNFSIIAFDSGYSWSFVAIPLFVFMGFLVVHHKLGESLFTTVYRWIGHVPGGLGISASIFSALFGFVSRLLTANMLQGSLAKPSPDKRSYSRGRGK